MDDRLRGVAAGLAGTAAMTVVQELTGSSGDAEPASEEDRWAKAPAPAQVVKRLAEPLVGPISADRIPLLTNLGHWLYGTTLGVAYGLVAKKRTHPLARGLAFGAGAWALSYAELVPLGLYEPPWRYPLETLVRDLSYHLTYGATVGVVHRAL
jgi:hypothetical protein